MTHSNANNIFGLTHELEELVERECASLEKEQLQELVAEIRLALQEAYQKGYNAAKKYYVKIINQ